MQLAEGRKESWQFAVCKAKNAKKTYRLSVLVAKSKNVETPKKRRSSWQNQNAKAKRTYRLNVLVAKKKNKETNHEQPETNPDREKV
ncbi:MAG TPA: hypothetical protein VL093_06930 [Flavipsychrobacter sp.]|nr:hypothetical protein [Flavipsychrobacter sp.]